MIKDLPDISDGAIFNTKQLAEFLSCHRNSVLLWQKKGLLKPKFHRRGKRVFLGKDIKKFFYGVL